MFYSRALDFRAWRYKLSLKKDWQVTAILHFGDTRSYDDGQKYFCWIESCVNHFLLIFLLAFHAIWRMIIVIYHTNISIIKTRAFIMIWNMCRKDLWSVSWSNQEAAKIEWIVASKVCIDEVVFMKEYDEVETAISLRYYSAPFTT